MGSHYYTELQNMRTPESRGASLTFGESDQRDIDVIRSGTCNVEVKEGRHVHRGDTGVYCKEWNMKTEAKEVKEGRHVQNRNVGDIRS